MARIKPPFKYYGGKFYLCKWIISNMPPHETYAEPFGGAASVLLNKPRCNREIYNDLNPDIANLMLYIRDDHDKFVERLRSIPCEESVYYQWKSSKNDNPFESAVRSFILYRMSRGGTGTTFSKSNRSYRGLPENVASWETSINNLIQVARRLQGVEIRCGDGLQLLEELNSPTALFYLDPPYVTSSRKNSRVYELEMSDQQHEQLAERCRSSVGKILISSYPSPLYSTLFNGWKCESRTEYLHGGHGKTKRLGNELLWKNF